MLQKFYNSRTIIIIIIYYVTKSTWIVTDEIDLNTKNTLYNDNTASSVYHIAINLKV